MDSLPSARKLRFFIEHANCADISITAAIRTDEERARGNDRFGRRGDDFLSSRRTFASNPHLSSGFCWFCVYWFQPIEPLDLPGKISPYRHNLLTRRSLGILLSIWRKLIWRSSLQGRRYICCRSGILAFIDASIRQSRSRLSRIGKKNPKVSDTLSLKN